MFFRQLLERRSISEAVEMNDPKLLEWLGISPGAVNVRGKNALRDATVYACIKILSETIAKLPLKVYQDRDGVSKATSHYLYTLLKLRPNPYMSSNDFFRCVEAQRNLFGNAYVSLEFDERGRVTGLYPLAADKVQVYVDDAGLLSSKNKVWYVVTIGAERRKLMADELLHFKGLTTDGIVGISPLDYLRYLVENGRSATQFINNFYRQGLQTKGIVQYVGDLNEEAKRVFREQFESMSSGLKNSHRISLLPLGYKFEPISLSMADAQFLENTELTIRQIATAFGVKMHQLNDLSRATHTNIAEQQREFYVDTLQAILTIYEQEINYKLLLQSEWEGGYYCRFNVDSILRSDIKTRYDAYRTGVQGGFITPNEARALEEKEPKDGGDQLLVNGNMLPITMVGEQYKNKKGGGKGGKTKQGSQGAAQDDGSAGDQGEDQ